MKSYYRSNPSITIAVKRPGLPLTTMEIDLTNRREVFKNLIGANYELTTLFMYGHYEDAPALFMAVDEFGFYKIFYESVFLILLHLFLF
jgi:hypothetical protein